MHYWGKRSEPYRSDLGRQFLCMYVYVCMVRTTRPDSRFLHTRSLPISCILIVFCTSDKKKFHKMNPDNESKQERQRIRRDRERQATAQETAEEKEVRLAKRREKHRALKFKVTIALASNPGRLKYVF